MSYDIDECLSNLPPTPNIETADRQDLEAITTLLELSALELTDRPGAEFTLEQLILGARELGGQELQIEEDDIQVALDKASFLQKNGSRLSLK